MSTTQLKLRSSSQRIISPPVKRSSSVRSNKVSNADIGTLSGIRKSLSSLTSKLHTIESMVEQYSRRLSSLQSGKSISFRSEESKKATPSKSITARARLTSNPRLTSKDSFTEFQNEISALKLGIVNDYWYQLNNLNKLFDQIRGNFGEEKSEVNDDVLLNNLEILYRKLKKREQLGEYREMSLGLLNAIRNFQDELAKRYGKYVTYPSSNASSENGASKRGDSTGVVKYSESASRSRSGSNLKPFALEHNYGSMKVSDEMSEGSSVEEDNSHLPSAIKKSKSSTKKKTTKSSATKNGSRLKILSASPSNQVIRVSSGKESATQSGRAKPYGNSVPANKSQLLYNYNTALTNSGNKFSTFQRNAQDKPRESVENVVIGNNYSEAMQRVRSLSQHRTISNSPSVQVVGDTTGSTTGAVKQMLPPNASEDNYRNAAASENSTGLLRIIPSPDPQSDIEYNAAKPINQVQSQSLPNKIGYDAIAPANLSGTGSKWPAYTSQSNVMGAANTSGSGYNLAGSAYSSGTGYNQTRTIYQSGTLNNQAGPIQPPANLNNQSGPVHPPANLNNQAGPIQPPANLNNQVGPIYPSANLNNQAGPVHPSANLNNQAGPVHPSAVDNRAISFVTPPKTSNVPSNIANNSINMGNNTLPSSVPHKSGTNEPGGDINGNNASKSRHSSGAHNNMQGSAKHGKNDPPPPAEVPQNSNIDGPFDCTAPHVRTFGSQSTPRDDALNTGTPRNKDGGDKPKGRLSSLLKRSSSKDDDVISSATQQNSQAARSFNCFTPSVKSSDPEIDVQRIKNLQNNYSGPDAKDFRYVMCTAPNVKSYDNEEDDGYDGRAVSCSAPGAIRTSLDDPDPYSVLLSGTRYE